MSISRSYKQSYLIKQANEFLAAVDSHEFMDERGNCHGLAVLFLCATWLQTLPLLQTTTQRDNLTWFYFIRSVLVEWDGHLASLQAIDLYEHRHFLGEDVSVKYSNMAAEVHRFITYIQQFQESCYITDVRQSNLNQLVQFTSQQAPQLVYSITGCFSADELIKPIKIEREEKETVSCFIESIAQNGSFLLIHSLDHATALVNYQGVYYHFDSNINNLFANMYTSQQLTTLAAEILKSHRKSDESTASMCFYAYQFSASKLEYPVVDSILRECDWTNEYKLSSAICMAMESRCYDSIDYYLSHQPVKGDAKNDRGDCGLITAILHSNMRVVNILLDRTRNVDLVDRDGKTPLYYALKFKQEGLVAKLLQKNADIKFLIKQKALIFCIENQLDQSIILLIKHHYPLDETNLKDDPALILAIKIGNIQAASLLLTHGANPNLRDSQNMSALHYAARFNQHKLARQLLQNGADLYAATPDGLLPLDYANPETEVYILLQNRMSSENDQNRFFRKRRELTRIVENEEPSAKRQKNQ